MCMPTVLKGVETPLSFSGCPCSNLLSDLRLNDHMVDLIEGGFMWRSASVTCQIRVAFCRIGYAAMPRPNNWPGAARRPIRTNWKSTRLSACYTRVAASCSAGLSASGPEVEIVPSSGVITDVSEAVLATIAAGAGIGMATSLMASGWVRRGAYAGSRRLCGETAQYNRAVARELAVKPGRPRLPRDLSKVAVTMAVNVCLWRGAA